MGCTMVFPGVALSMYYFVPEYKNKQTTENLYRIVMDENTKMHRIVFNS